MSAREAGISASQALIVKKSEKASGGSTTGSQYLHSKSPEIYSDKFMLATMPGDVHHWDFVADRGKHSYKEVMLSLGCWWEHDVGGVPPWAHLRPGKQLVPCEADLEDFTAELAYLPKQDRVASYKQFQGFSHQIRSATKDALSLADTKLPEECNACPVGRKDERKVEGEDGKNVVYLENRVDGSRQPVLPPRIHFLRLLVLDLDQGPQGTPSG